MFSIVTLLTGIRQILFKVRSLHIFDPFTEKTLFNPFSALFTEYISVGEVLLSGYLLHYLPFLFYDRTLFIHHYLTGYVFKLMLTAFVTAHIYKLIR